jgi:hypothetical protein
MKLKAFAAAGATALLTATAAFAAVTFDATTGTGFVGKGDVQLEFGWNNAALQRNASGVSFQYKEETFYDVTCEWETVTGGPRSKTILHDVTLNKRTSVRSSIAYDPRVRNQITGFNLTGLSSSISQGTEPVVGGSCPQAHATAEITEVVETRSSGGLFVEHGGISKLLPPQL